MANSALFKVYIQVFNHCYQYLSLLLSSRFAHPGCSPVPGQWARLGWLSVFKAMPHNAISNNVDRCPYTQSQTNTHTHNTHSHLTYGIKPSTYMKSRHQSKHRPILLQCLQGGSCAVTEHLFDYRTSFRHDENNCRFASKHRGANICLGSFPCAALQKKQTPHIYIHAYTDSKYIRNQKLACDL
jgi:hypothetical protein